MSSSWFWKKHDASRVDALCIPIHSHKNSWPYSYFSLLIPPYPSIPSPLHSFIWNTKRKRQKTSENVRKRHLKHPDFFRNAAQQGALCGALVVVSQNLELATSGPEISTLPASWCWFLGGKTQSAIGKWENQTRHRWVCLKMGYTPNEIAI